MNIIMAGGKMLVGVFFILIVYFLLSTPIEAIFNSFDDANTGEATDDMDIYLPIIRQALTMAIAICLVTPILIFIFSAFERETQSVYDRRFYR